MLKNLLTFKSKKEMEKWYDKRVEALKRLAQHEDFEELIKYWEIEHDKIDNTIDSLKGRELEDAVLERTIIRKHIKWIRSLTT